jgi:hypothetical protein
MGVSAADHRQFVGREQRSRHRQISGYGFDLLLFYVLSAPNPSLSRLLDQWGPELMTEVKWQFCSISEN